MVHPRVFLDFAVDGSPVGRVIFELYNVSAPKAAENFRALCTGEKGLSPISQQPLYYKNSIVHRSIKDFMIQGGDFTKRNGTGGESIYGGPFADEDLSRPVDAAGLLVMANRGPNTNGSQFFITLRECPHLNGKHVVFGHVIRGFEDIIAKIAQVPTDEKDRPSVPVVITSCGELELRRPPVKSHSSVSASEEDSEDERERKRRKKKHQRRSPSPSDLRSRSRSQSRARTPDPLKSKGKKSKSKHKKSKHHRARSRSRSRSVGRGKDGEGERHQGGPPRVETEEEYDARLEREENERLEAARKRELERIKRQYENSLKSSDGIRFKGRGKMKYLDPELLESRGQRDHHD